MAADERLTPEIGPGPRPERFRDAVHRPVFVVAAIVGTIVSWPFSHILYPPVALTLFVLASVFAVATLFPWTRLPQWSTIAIISAYLLLGVLLLPLAHTTSTASLFPFIAASDTGWKVASRRVAIGIAVTGAVVAAGFMWLVERQAPEPGQWPWWIALTVCLPVYVGMSQRDRLDAVFNARRAEQQARRAVDSEARVAALRERGRIAREIHDVLGHSLSGIALQLDMADALRESGRDDEATAAIRNARALAVDSISETRRAIQALREDTLPLPETLRRMAEGNAAGFEIDGHPCPLGADTTHTLVRVAQEALTNAAKHAPGATRTVRLACTGDRTTLTVTNTAADCPAPATDGSGLGLVGMRERVALLGGTLHAGPRPAGDGWRVEVEIPR